MSTKTMEEFLGYLAEGEAEKNSHSNYQSSSFQAEDLSNGSSSSRTNGSEEQKEMEAEVFENFDKLSVSPSLQMSFESDDDRRQRLAGLNELWDKFVYGTDYETEKSNHKDDQSSSFRAGDVRKSCILYVPKAPEEPKEMKGEIFETFDKSSVSSDVKKYSESIEERQQRLASLKELWDRFISDTKETDKTIQRDNQSSFCDTKDENNGSVQHSSSTSDGSRDMSPGLVETVQKFRTILCFSPLKRNDGVKRIKVKECRTSSQHADEIAVDVIKTMNSGTAGVGDRTEEKKELHHYYDYSFL